MTIPNNCDHNAVMWRRILPPTAHAAINTVLKYYKAVVANETDHWYIMAIFDEYAKEAHQAINEIQNERNMHTALFQPLLLLKYEWDELTWCERYLFKYQEHVNRLGNNLQCATTTTLIATPSFYLSLMPTANAQSDLPLFVYMEKYNAMQLKEIAQEELDGQPKCASRMLSGRLSELSKMLWRIH